MNLLTAAKARTVTCAEVSTDKITSRNGTGMRGFTISKTRTMECKNLSVTQLPRNVFGFISLRSDFWLRISFNLTKFLRSGLFSFSYNNKSWWDIQSGKLVEYKIKTALTRYDFWDQWNFFIDVINVVISPWTTYNPLAGHLNAMMVDCC